MKKMIPIILFIAFACFSCNNESEDSNIEAKSTKKSARLAEPEEGHESTLSAGWPCPDGWVSIWVFKWPLPKLKSWTTCKGFGVCPIFSAIVTQDCVKLGKDPVGPANPAYQAMSIYNAATDDMSVTFQKLNATTMRMCVDGAAQSSPSHIASDFNTFEIGTIFLDPHHRLNAGSYSKHTSGAYLYYDILFTYVP